MKYFTQHMTKIQKTYEQILDNIYEFLRQHMTYFTQHMKIFYTTYVNNLYNIYKNYTPYDHLLRVDLNLLKRNQRDLRFET